MMRQKFKILLGIILLAICIACKPVAGKKTTFEYMPGMMDSPAIKAQEKVMRPPVPGTRARGFKPYPFKKEEGDLAGEVLQNPLPLTKVVLAQGQKAYNTFCVVCHGPRGKGNGSIVPKFPMPPSLHSDKVKIFSDGRLFHIMTMGQNLMSSYSSQIPEQERWAISYYVRALQRAVNPTPEDIEAYKQVKGK